ncbi:MAG: beta-ketoacyl synthase N-terminal-like domain-containing protein [Anaerolineales bacterium]|jgi:acetyl-CoA C-acetyltransferase
MKNNNQHDIIVAGIGLTPVGELWETSLKELAYQAILQARHESGDLEPQVLYVANALSPQLSNQAHLGALIADFAGLRGIEAATVEAAGASGGMALRQAYLALRSGLVDVALVVGVEKVSERVSAEIEAAANSAGDADYEAPQGLTATTQAALMMRRYMHDYQVPADGLSGFGLTAHANGVANPNAMFRKALKPESYGRAPMVSEPVNLFDAAPLADGAAAIMLARAEVLPDKLPFPKVRIAASSSSTDSLALHDRPELLQLRAAVESSHRAYAQAGIKPSDLDLFELHDRFSILAALSLEAAGLAQPGQGWKLAAEGAIGLDGTIPTMTFGGSKARGDAIGATGVYQAIEVILQLQSRAGDNQIKNARLGMAQCLAGTGGTAATHIFERIESS